jgi:hypothetical protein
MSTPIVSEHTARIPELPDHAFRLVKVVETRKDADGRDVHVLTVSVETLVDGAPSRTKIASLALQPGATPSLAWQGYMERDD